MIVTLYQYFPFSPFSAFFIPIINFPHLPFFELILSTLIRMLGTFYFCSLVTLLGKHHFWSAELSIALRRNMIFSFLLFYFALFYFIWSLFVLSFIIWVETWIFTDGTDLFGFTLDFLGLKFNTNAWKAKYDKLFKTLYSLFEEGSSQV